MKTIKEDELVTVTGGKNDALTQQVTSLQSSIKDLAASQSSNKSGDPTTMMMMMMALRPQPSQTVVAAPAAAAPVININTRVGRRW